MADPDTDQTPERFADLPILPTGSGVADLEVAYEQMRLAEEGDSVDDSTTAGVVSDPAAYDSAAAPTEGGADAAESAAHPS